MSPARHLGLALRLLHREWRAGELRVLLSALVVAVSAATTIDFFTQRIGQGMEHRSAALLGADLVLVSSSPVPESWRRQARQLGLKASTTLSFTSMIAAGDRFQLASVKAVRPPWPLRGHPAVADHPGAEDRPAKGLPQPGEAWLDARLFHRLDVAPGDSIEIGNAHFVARRVLAFDPGLRMDLLGLAPRVLIHADAVAATGVVRPGSRLSHSLLLAGPTDALQRFRTWVEPRLEAGQQLVGLHQGRRMTGAALVRAERFLGLAVLMALVLAGVAIAMAARRYSRRHHDSAALMRCLGASGGELLWLHGWQLLSLGLAGSLAGAALGWAAHWGLVWLLADLLPAVPGGFSFTPLLTGLATGMVVLAGFALPPLLNLVRVRPLRVLRGDLLPPSPPAALAGLSALAVLLLLVHQAVDDWRMILMLLGGALAMLLLLGMVSMALMGLGRLLEPRLTSGWRLGLKQLRRQRLATLGQVMAFGVVFMALTSLVLVRTALLEEWRAQLPEETPNHFLLNILPEQVEPLSAFLARRDIAAADLYPMVRGRLATLNGRPIRQAVPASGRNHNSLHRELNLSWTGDLPEGNRLVDGRWFTDADRGLPLVSVESTMAEALGLKVDDRLGFRIGAEQSLEATIVSLRKLRWDSFRPNFYVLFPPGMLEGFPATWMTSFHLPADDRQTLPALVQRFPAVSVLELEPILAQVQSIIGQLSLAVEYVLLFVLAAGLAVLWAVVESNLDERLREAALLRALGAGGRQLRQALLAEFLGLGVMAGLLAALVSEVLMAFLYSQVLNLEAVPHPLMWLVTPLLGAGLTGTAGWLATRRVLRESPLAVLRRV